MLKLKNVSKFYYNKGVVSSGFSKVNLNLHIGEFVVITIVGLPVFKMVNNKYGNKIKNFSSK